jgi:uncharacterized FlaG/YvyC family protein
MSGAITGASVTVTAPGKTMGAPQPARTKGENIDAGPEQVKQMVADMQSHLDSMNISLQYSLYGAHNEKVAVKVVNRETGDVIREIPPKEMQALQAKMSELCGMIFNGKG